MTFSRARICAVALFIAPVVGACGDDGGLSGAKAAYVAQVDPICAELQPAIGELGENPQEQATEIEEAVGRIRAVENPREDRERANLYIAAMQNLYLSLQDVHQARLVNDQARAERALEGARANNKTAAEAAEEYGMVVCAREL